MCCCLSIRLLDPAAPFWKVGKPFSFSLALTGFFRSLSWVSAAITFILGETIYLFKSCLAALALRLLLPGYLPSSLFTTSVRMTEHFSLVFSSRLYTSTNNRRTSARSVKLSTPSEQRVALRRGRRRYCRNARPPPLWCLSNSLLPTMCISTRFKSFGIIYITIIRRSIRSLPEDISHCHWPSREANSHSQHVQFRPNQEPERDPRYHSQPQLDSWLPHRRYHVLH